MFIKSQDKQITRLEITGSSIYLLALFTAQELLFVYENSLLLKYKYFPIK